MKLKNAVLNNLVNHCTLICINIKYINHPKHADDAQDKKLKLKKNLTPSQKMYGRNHTLHAYL